MSLSSYLMLTCDVIVMKFPADVHS